VLLSGCGADNGPSLLSPGPGGGSATAGSMNETSAGTDDGGSDGAGDDTTGGPAGPAIIDDPQNGLQWFDGDVLVDYAAAVQGCDLSEVGGFDDWRLPRIQEHFVHAVGCEIQAAGSCLLEDPGCLDTLCGDPNSACPTCPSVPGDCAYDPSVWGTDCSVHPVYWSGSGCSDCGPEVQWAYDFTLALPVPLAGADAAAVRCVRTN